MWNTSGHSVRHMPWPRHRSSSTVTFIESLLREVEFEVQLGEPAQDVGRNVLVATVTGGAVVRLADPDVGGAVQQALEPDPGFGAGQRCAGAAVDAAAEGQVLTGVLALRDRTCPDPRTGAGRGWPPR